MCGILGFSAPKGVKLNKDKIKMLFYFNQERGKDSLGYYTPESGIIKKLGKAEDIMGKPDFDIPESNVLIGHIRAATVGSVTEKNAHPFVQGNIVLVMNGTLTNHWDLCRENGLSIHDYDVDSDVLTALINRSQSKEPLTKILGGCAIIYTDTNTGKVYCYRNADRPLYRGNLDGAMYMSSVENSLKVIGCTTVKEFRQDILYEIENGRVLSHTKVKRATPTYSYTNNSLGWKYMSMMNAKNEELVGLWLEPEWDFVEAGLEFKKGRLYEVWDYALENTYEIGVMVGDSYVKVRKSRFKDRVYVIRVNDYAFAKTAVYYKDKNEGCFALKGDLILITEIEDGKHYTGKNIVNNKEAILYANHIRYAMKDEVEEWRNEFFKLDEPNESNIIGHSTNIQSREEAIFQSQVEATEHKNFEELADFTCSEILDQVTDLEELSLQSNQLVKINNIKALLNNYVNKKDIVKIEEEILNAGKC